MGGHQGDGEVSWVGVGPQIAALEHCCESAAKEVEPLVIAGGQVIDDVLVGFQQLASQGSVDASNPCVTDSPISPC
jgi:hypothetical protein